MQNGTLRPIPFNRTYLTGRESVYVAEAMTHGPMSGDGPFTKRASTLLAELMGVPAALLTTSCTHALDMTALLLDRERPPKARDMLGHPARQCLDIEPVLLSHRHGAGELLCLAHAPPCRVAAGLAAIEERGGAVGKAILRGTPGDGKVATALPAREFAIDNRAALRKTGPTEPQWRLNEETILGRTRWLLKERL